MEQGSPLNGVRVRDECVVWTGQMPWVVCQPLGGAVQGSCTVPRHASEVAAGFWSFVSCSYLPTAYVYAVIFSVLQFLYILLLEMSR